MKLLFQVMVLAVMLVVSSCSVQRAYRTSSAHAAYGEAVSAFGTNKKKDQKKKKKARRAAQRKRSTGNQSLWRGRPY